MTDKTVEVVERLRSWPHGARQDDYSVASIKALMELAASELSRLQEEVKGLRDNLRYEDEWPATPVSNALHEHFLAVYGLNNEEACESVGEILDVINEALATLQGQQS